jgi:hypothetical protein
MARGVCSRDHAAGFFISALPCDAERVNTTWARSRVNLRMTAARGHLADDAGVGGVAFSPDGRRAISCGVGDKKVRLWDVETGQELACFAGHRDAVMNVAFSPDGRYAVSGGGGRVPCLSQHCAVARSGWTRYDRITDIMDMIMGWRLGQGPCPV